MDKDVTSSSPFALHPSPFELGPYPAYQDAGVPWLGDVPAHWEVLPGRACYHEKKVPNKGLKEKTVLSLSYGQIVIKPPEKLHGLVPASFETYQIIDPGDIIIRPTDLQNDWNSLRFGLSHHRGIITSAYMCFHTQDALTREYGHLLLHTYDLMKLFYGLGSGLRQNLSWEDFKYLPCLAPPLPEQRAIAAFLTHIDRVTRRTIRAQQRLIELLKEQKQALIQQAVTRGLDLDAPLKESGIAWLGEIPAHWEVASLKHLSSITTGNTPPKQDTDNYVNGEIVWVKPDDLMGTKPISDSKEKLTKLGAALARVVPKGSALVCCIGTIGKIGVAGVPLATNQQINAVIFDNPSEWLPEYGLYALMASERELQRQANNVVISILNKTGLSSAAYPIPHLSEQCAIATYLDEQANSIDAAIDHTQRRIDLIREYRTRLIADVVTGKLDVRDVPLPTAASGDDLDTLEDDATLEDFADMEFQEETDE